MQVRKQSMTGVKCVYCYNLPELRLITPHGIVRTIVYIDIDGEIIPRENFHDDKPCAITGDKDIGILIIRQISQHEYDKARRYAKWVFKEKFNKDIDGDVD